MSDEDTGAMPKTAAHPAPIFDTGPQSEPFSSPFSAPVRAWSLVDDDIAAKPLGRDASVAVAEPPAAADTGGDQKAGAAASVARQPATTEPVAAVSADEPAPGTGSSPAGKPRHTVATPRSVPGQYYFLRWWQLLLLLVAVWIPAYGIGLGLFYWWHQSLDKTPAVFAVLVYVVVCTVGALMMAMVPDRPLVSALAIGAMSAVPASLVAAAVLYGHYYCQQVSPCVAGILPH